MGDLEWDNKNESHVARHGVTPLEVNELFAGKHLLEPAPYQAEPRFLAYGRTAHGRYLVVVFTYRNRRVRPITAYPMNRSTRKFYVPQLKEQEQCSE